MSFDSEVWMPNSTQFVLRYCSVMDVAAVDASLWNRNLRRPAVGVSPRLAAIRFGNYVRYENSVMKYRPDYIVNTFGFPAEFPAKFFLGFEDDSFYYTFMYEWVTYESPRQVEFQVRENYTKYASFTGRSVVRLLNKVPHAVAPDWVIPADVDCVASRTRSRVRDAASRVDQIVEDATYRREAEEDAIDWQDYRAGRSAEHVEHQDVVDSLGHVEPGNSLGAPMPLDGDGTCWSARPPTFSTPPIRSQSDDVRIKFDAVMRDIDANASTDLTEEDWEILTNGTRAEQILHAKKLICVENAGHLSVPEALRNCRFAVESVMFKDTPKFREVTIRKVCEFTDQLFAKQNPLAERFRAMLYLI
jgi:hypothetical protein